METVIVDDVTEGNNGWHEVKLVDDTRVLATKDKKIADAAFQSIGKELQVEVGVKKNGNFTNYYLNAIEGLETNGNVAPAPKARAPRKTSAPAPQRDDRQDQIQAQWAVGRATELLAASGQDYTVPLSTDEFAALEAQATALLALSKKLAQS